MEIQELTPWHMTFTCPQGPYETAGSRVDGKSFLALLGLNLSVTQMCHILKKRCSVGIKTLAALHDGIRWNQPVIGTASLLIGPTFTGNAAYLEDVVVADAWRGKGVATALVTRCIEIAAEKSCYKVVLDCSEEKVDFYRKFSFKKNGRAMRLAL